jgi:uncharacterized protein YjaZ
MCQELLQSFEERKPANIYSYLIKFGMYRPNHKAYENYNKLKESNCWENAEGIFQKYRNKWKGPDIPVYIFPAAANTNIFYKSGSTKSGVAFKDKLFLFISPQEDEKQIEALIIHEYHHTCRLNRKNKHQEDYTLLDSIVLEGLAEHAVVTYCGKKYRAKWCDYYTREEIERYWKSFLSKEMQVKKDNRLHDEILYGHKGYPKLIGYAAGYEIVSSYYKEKKFRIEESFKLPSSNFIMGFPS